jgi:hypothetical protein
VGKVDGHSMIDLDYKLDTINKRIEAIQVQIDFLSNSIKFNPVWDEPEKPSRESVLDTYNLRLEALNSFKASLD